MRYSEHSIEYIDVLVIGSGGAGLRSAIEAKTSGVSVKILGKRPKEDSHTVLAAGGINAAFGNLDKEDCWQQHFADTYIEGYGIGDHKAIEIMAKESMNIVIEIDKWGANLAKINNRDFDQRFFGAHTYRRTCYSGDFTGKSIIKALLKRSQELSIPINDYEYVTDLLTKDSKCFGAMSLNIKSGERTAHIAKSVILATGGHTRIWKRSSSRRHENNGDGFYLGLKAGCSLINMEMVQFHPTGMIFPDDIAGTLVTEAVRGEGGILRNSKGERFMKKYDSKRMELSTRDRVTIANYTEIIEGRGTERGGVYLDISHKDKAFILEKIPSIHRQFVEFQMLDISEKPMEVAPTAHYSMGGLVVSPEEHFTGIEGLYAAGEVVGGLHGANRLGGNSLAEILIFGKRAGKFAAKHAKNIKYQDPNKNVINSAHGRINSRIKSGKDNGLDLTNELGDLMWRHCGVIRNDQSLKLGLEKLRDIKIRIEKLNVQIDSGNYEDLIIALNLEAETISAEATLLSALERKESRGAHQRKDYPKREESERLNYYIKLSNIGELDISKKSIKNIDNQLLRDYINKTEKITTFEGKLLE